MHGNFGFGGMRLPMKGQQVDLALFAQMVDAFLLAGFNYFDTAHGYVGGQSETALRDCLVKRYPRDRFLLTDKLSTHFFTKEEEVRPLLEQQLAACGVEYFDFLLMHAQDAAIYEKYLRCKAYEQSLAFVAEGKAKHFGISFHDKADVLDRILTDWPQIEIVQIQLNYVDWEDVSVESKKVHDVCAKHGKPVIIMEPVKGGNLVNLPEEAQKPLARLNQERGTQASNASYALRFAGSQPQTAMVLSGILLPFHLFSFDGSRISLFFFPVVAYPATFHMCLSMAANKMCLSGCVCMQPFAWSTPLTKEQPCLILVYSKLYYSVLLVCGRSVLWITASGSSGWRCSSAAW